MRIVIAILLSLVLALLSACTSEKGIKRHKMKGSQEGSMLHHPIWAIWEATVSKDPAAAAEVVGVYASRDECSRMAMEYIEKKGYENALHACSR